MWLFLLMAYAQEAPVVSDVPADLQGSDLEKLVFLKREFGPLGLLIGLALFAYARGWRPQMPAIRHEVVIKEPVAVRNVRVRIPPAPVAEVVEDVSAPFAGDDKPRKRGLGPEMTHDDPTPQVADFRRPRRGGP